MIFLSQDSQGGVPKLSRFGLPRLYEFITLYSDLRLGWGLKKTCRSPWELSNGVLYSTCTHRGRVDFRLLVVGSQTGNLTPGPSFCHNLWWKCLNGSCEAIFDIYTSIAFQWHEEGLKARCFDPCNRTLKFRESWRTPKSPFRECECHPHTLPKVGLWHLILGLLNQFNLPKCTPRLTYMEHTTWCAIEKVMNKRHHSKLVTTILNMLWCPLALPMHMLFFNIWWMISSMSIWMILWFATLMTSSLSQTNGKPWTPCTPCFGKIPS
jgi:hypothetical protein